MFIFVSFCNGGLYSLRARDNWGGAEVARCGKVRSVFLWPGRFAAGLSGMGKAACRRDDQMSEGVSIRQSSVLLRVLIAAMDARGLASGACIVT